MVFAGPTAFFAAPGRLVHRGPGPSGRFVFRKAAMLITFLDVLGLAFLFFGIFRFISAWHDLSPISRGLKSL